MDYSRVNFTFIVLKLRHSVHLFIFAYPFPILRSLSPDYNHQSTHLPLPLLLLPVIGWLIAFLLPWMFSPTVGKSKCSYAESEKSYFYDLENPKTFVFPNRILGQASLKPIKPGLSLENRDKWYL
jgi:hypothetical protein